MSSQSQKSGKAISPFLSGHIYSSTDVNCFESTKVLFPFSDSDQHLIVSYSILEVPTSHQLVVART